MTSHSKDCDCKACDYCVKFPNERSPTTGSGSRDDPLVLLPSEAAMLIQQIRNLPETTD